MLGLDLPSVEPALWALIFVMVRIGAAFIAAPMFRAVAVPLNVRIAEAPSHGLPVLIYDNACAGSQAYILLASEFIRRRRTAAEAGLSSEAGLPVAGPSATGSS